MCSQPQDPRWYIGWSETSWPAVRMVTGLLDAETFSAQSLSRSTEKIQVNNDYVQQCAAPILTDGNTRTLNIQLTRYANLSSSTPPTLSPPNTRIVAGLVFKTIDGSRQPVAGAGVEFEPFIDFPAALTRTDASGRYLLCGLPMSRIVLGASSTTSNATYLMVDAVSDAVVDIELK